MDRWVVWLRRAVRAGFQPSGLATVGAVARPPAMRWYRSIAVKCCAAAFVATHIPLLGLLAFVTLAPDALSPLMVLGVALVFTLAATAAVLAVLWRMFQPLRAAADGLHDFMAHGRAFAGEPRARDEVGRLVNVLVKALAHLDRSRTPLLFGGAYMLGEKAQLAGVEGEGNHWLALLEIDGWDEMEGAVSIEAMSVLQHAARKAIRGVLRQGEVVMPWGRGRFLAVMDASAADCVERLQTLRFRVSATSPQEHTITAVLEPKQKRSTRWPAALQRLEHRLYRLRVEGHA